MLHGLQRLSKTKTAFSAIFRADGVLSPSCCINTTMAGEAPALSEPAVGRDRNPGVTPVKRRDFMKHVRREHDDLPLLEANLERPQPEARVQLRVPGIQVGVCPGAGVEETQQAAAGLIGRNLPDPDAVNR